MIIKIQELRQLIKDEYLRGVPEYALRDLTKRYVDSIRELVGRHIEMTTKDPIQTREAIEATTEVMASLEEDVNQVLEEKLWQFMQRT